MRSRCGYRRRRLLPIILEIAAIPVTVGIVVAGFAVLIGHLRAGRPQGPAPSVSARASPAKPACPAARLPDAATLGDLAWIEDGSLNMIDLGTCRQSSLVDTGAAPPVRFSPDGRWLAFGEGEVVAATGGQVRQPFGAPVRSWEWSPTEDLLAGVTEGGGLLIARPGGEPLSLLSDGSGVGHLAVSPDGSRVAVDRVGRGIQLIDPTTGKTRTILVQTDPVRVPEVAGWSPDGRWVLYWRGPVRSNGGPLDAVPTSGGPWVNVFDPMLPYRDFLGGCGSQVAVSVGSGEQVTVGKQIVLTGPPSWAFHDLTDDFSRSWFWPACSPDGRWLAATDSFNQKESADRTIPRALWLLATDGSSRDLLVPGTHGAVEYPRWSSDGAVILVVVRAGDRWSSAGRVLLVRVNPRSGRLVRTVGPIVELGSAPGPGGHERWAEISDWSRP